MAREPGRTCCASSGSMNGVMAMTPQRGVPGAKDPGIRDAVVLLAAHVVLNDLAFIMTGSWRAMETDGLSEEVWSAPHGNSIMGTFRIVGADGSLKMQEVLAIVAEPEGVFMRLRHFDAKMVSREEKDAPIVLKLETSEGERAVFRCVSGSKSLHTITYWRIEQTLHSEVAFTPESKRAPLTFSLRRVTDGSN